MIIFFFKSRTLNCTYKHTSFKTLSDLGQSPTILARTVFTQKELINIIVCFQAAGVRLEITFQLDVLTNAKGFSIPSELTAHLDTKPGISIKLRLYECMSQIKRDLRS